MLLVARRRRGARHRRTKPDLRRALDDRDGRTASRPAGSPATTAPSASCSICCRGPTFAQQVAGTRAFFRALNALGLTGVLDPGGYNMPIEDYRPLFQVWRDRALTRARAPTACARRAAATSSKTSRR